MYTKILGFEDALATFKLCSFFGGSETAKFAALNISEKISEQIKQNSTKKPVLDKDGNPELNEDGKQKIEVTPPEKITVVLTRAELDGFFIGVKESFGVEGVTVGDIASIKQICAVLGMRIRFAKYSEKIVAEIERNNEPLDSELIEDPLD